MSLYTCLKDIIMSKKRYRFRDYNIHIHIHTLITYFFVYRDIISRIVLSHCVYMYVYILTKIKKKKKNINSLVFVISIISYRYSHHTVEFVT